MIVRNLQSWNDFEFEVEKLMNLKTSGPRLFANNLLFRGHPDAKWKLQTTLERYMGDKQSLTDYYSLITSIKPRIETFTSKIWEVPDHFTYNKWQMEIDPVKGPDSFPAHEYMVYLRHHGFPSPLLD